MVDHLVRRLVREPWRQQSDVLHELPDCNEDPQMGFIMRSDNEYAPKLND